MGVQTVRRNTRPGDTDLGVEWMEKDESRKKERL